MSLKRKCVVFHGFSCISSEDLLSFMAFSCTPSKDVFFMAFSCFSSEDVLFFMAFSCISSEDVLFSYGFFMDPKRRRIVRCCDASEDKSHPPSIGHRGSISDGSTKYKMARINNTYRSHILPTFSNLICPYFQK